MVKIKIFIPNKIFNKVNDITYDEIKKFNIKGFLLDIDNTLAGDQDPNPFEGVVDWIEILRKNDIKILLISNNGEERVSKFAKLLKLDYISKGNKPFKKNIIRGCNILKVPHENICIVGDQIFTDIFGGNISNIKTFLVTEVHTS